MACSYRARRGGTIEVISEKAASELLSEPHERYDTNRSTKHDDDFIADFMQQNNKRIQVIMH
jgi:hypothetical protein